MTEQDLLRLKKKVDDAKTNVAELKGQQTALLKQLKEDGGCKSLEELEKKLKALAKEIGELQTELETGIEEIQQTYEL
jgi:hypothetical protein